MIRLVTLLVIALAGCITPAQQMEAARVRVLNPQPIVTPPPGLAVGLVLGTSVPDQFVIPELNGITPVPVEGWRVSLSNAFHNTFQPAQQVAVVVQLNVARLDYLPSGQFARDGRLLTGAAKARIRFAVSFLDATGRQVDAMTGEAISTQPWMEMGGSSSTAAEAIEVMYAQISERLARLPTPAAASI